VRARAISLLRVLARLPRVPGTEAAECTPIADDRNARPGGSAVSLLRMVRSGGRVAQWTQEALIPADARVGMEVRPVLLDTPLVELALALPGTCKLREDRHKAVLTDAFPDALPQHVAERPKQGFQVPVRLWTPRACRDRWMAAFDTDAARALLAPGFRHRAQAACRERRPATQREWAAFVLTEVMRRQRLSL
jgi:asparagine synthetase B (glutamine-hydrolysing)